ncbi:MAG: DUF159 family protein [Bacteroidetes bacterium HGW-Bacteroidetes-1]|jgi:putative SOS response-associated peptidase YedK|nr:MAG: DUF159 family protein [Bacteroidetes bacterium HGW-Bacteroidetes-1]
MCGRFQLSVKGKEISERFQIEVHDDLHRPDLSGAISAQGYNCAPMQWLPVITNDKPETLQYLRWGLVPQWAKNSSLASKMINSRAETIDQKHSFKNAFSKRRCLIPANGFYEWKSGIVKQPYRFFVRGETLFAMAGIWEQWNQPDGVLLQTFSIITTEANSLMKPIHNRMPLILSPEHEQTWLREQETDYLIPLLKPFPSDRMDYYAVSNKVNSAAIDEPSLIEKADDLSKGLFDQPQW